MHPTFRIEQRIATNFRHVKAINIESQQNIVENVVPEEPPLHIAQSFLQRYPTAIQLRPHPNLQSQELYKKLNLVRLRSTTQFIVLYLTLQSVFVRKVNMISC